MHDIKALKQNDALTRRDIRKVLDVAPRNNAVKRGNQRCICKRILRDLDLLEPLATLNLLSVFISVTTLDRTLSRRMEPRAATPARRLDTIRELTSVGVPVGVMVAPIIPGLSEHEIDNILEAVAEAGAHKAGYVMLRLPHETRTLFMEWLEAHYPDRARKVMSMVHDLRGGKANDPCFGTRMTGTGPYAEMISARFKLAAKRHGLATSNMATKGLGLATNLFKPPPQIGDQFSLFDSSNDN